MTPSANVDRETIRNSDLVPGHRNLAVMDLPCRKFDQERGIHSVGVAGGGCLGENDLLRRPGDPGDPGKGWRLIQVILVIQANLNQVQSVGLIQSNLDHTRPRGPSSTRHQLASVDEDSDMG